MRYQIRPLVTWTDPVTTERKSSSRFRASWKDTLEFLADEIEKIGGRDPVVIQVDVQEGDIRADGMLRANAKVGHPGVVVSFESSFGPLRYATDAYERDWSQALPSWQANLRAIALTLHALRAIDRWGVTKRGEQYTGWKALPAAGSSEFADADAAEEWMRAYAAEVIGPGTGRWGGNLPSLYRALVKVMHPDRGGPRADWDRLDAARQRLEAEGRLK